MGLLIRLLPDYLLLVQVPGSTVLQVQHLLLSAGSRASTRQHGRIVREGRVVVGTVYPRRRVQVLLLMVEGRKLDLGLVGVGMRRVAAGGIHRTKRGGHRTG